MAKSTCKHYTLVETRFARLWHSQGKTTEANDLLAPVYGWFSETGKSDHVTPDVESPWLLARAERHRKTQRP